MTSDKRTFHVHPNLETSEDPDPVTTPVNMVPVMATINPVAREFEEPFVYVNARPDEDLDPLILAEGSLNAEEE